MSKVLLSAFACYPNSGSEPYVGWNWQNMYPKNFDVYVLTRKYNQRFITGNENSKVTYIYFDIPFFENKDHYWRYIKLYYLTWQFMVFFKIFWIQISEKFNIIHHVTYNNIDVSGFLWLVPSTKFIWGPVGGGQAPPEELKQVYYRSWVKQKIRIFLKSLSTYNPINYMARKRASLVMCANKETFNLVNVNDKSEIFLETAIEESRITEAKLWREDLLKRLIWVGRIEERKALIIALDVIYALKKMKFDVHLTIVGDGPDLDLAKNWIKDLKLEDNTTITGRVNFSEVDEMYKNSSVFLFTSVQDTSGNVVLEAMAAGLPILALDHQGVKEIITPGGGILIGVNKYHKVIEDYTHSLINLSNDKNLYEKLSSEGIWVVNKYHTWESKRKLFLFMLRKYLGDIKK